MYGHPPQPQGSTRHHPGAPQRPEQHGGSGRQAAILAGVATVLAAIIGAAAVVYTANKDGDPGAGPGQTTGAETIEATEDASAPPEIAAEGTVLTADSTGDNGDGTSWALDVAEGSHAVGTQVTLWHFALDSAGKQWGFAPVSEDADDYVLFNMKNPNRDTVLAQVGGAIVLAAYERGEKSQQWVVDGTMLSNVASNECLAYGDIEYDDEGLLIGRSLYATPCSSTSVSWQLPSGL